jgi:phosphatidylserine/phosphatidylglycerophosphate/cardiolipin synthase-like enzyme
MDQPLSVASGHSSYASILAPGRNCGLIARARRMAVLVDASEYFRRLEHALERAEQSVLIVGWDFDGRIKLCPDDRECQPLGHFLRSLVDRRPNLQIRILVWSGAIVHAPGDPMPLLFGADWQKHPNIILKLDQHHPLYAAHHQKIVVIDDRLAFAGGIDLTIDRWDTCGHSERDQFRVRPDGDPYRPVHDVQMMVDGGAAAAIGSVARDRWLTATGETLTSVDGATDLWQSDLVPDFVDTDIGIVRTVPGWGKTQSINEVARLTEDMLSAGRRSIYIESQYLTASNVRRLLSTMLRAKRGPEIVILVKKSSPGVLERFVMGANRDRMIRYLHRADLNGRLRIYYPVMGGSEGPCEILLHSKLFIVDDRLMRIGSSNLNNRSMGLDTECDLVVEAVDGVQRAKIVEIRNRLLAEHLGVSPDIINAAVERSGSLIQGIDACNINARGLRPFTELELEGPTKPTSGTAVMDPARPLKIL